MNNSNHRPHRPRFTEAEARKVFSQLGLALSITHMHEGNSGGKIGPKGAFKYVTFASVWDPVTGHVIADGYAACGLRDNPSRKRGRAIAIGRAYKNYWEAHHNGETSNHII